MAICSGVRKQDCNGGGRSSARQIRIPNKVGSVRAVRGSTCAQEAVCLTWTPSTTAPCTSHGVTTC